MTVKITKPEINIREKLTELHKPSGIAGEAMLRAETVRTQQELLGVGRKNILINGSFMVSQRGDYASSNTPISAGTTNTYHLDRWQLRTGGVNSEDRKITNGFQNQSMHGDSYRIRATSTDTGYLRFLQRVEGNLAGNWITFSGWVKSNHPNAYLMAYQSWLGTRAFSKPHSGSGQWEYLTVTYYDEATGGDNTTLYFDAGIISNAFGNTTIYTGDYLEVAQLQVELGKVATPFEYRSYGEELTLCKRYYQIYKEDGNPVETGLGYFNTTTQAQIIIPFSVEMRGEPAMSYSNIAHFDIEPFDNQPSSIALASTSSPKMAVLSVVSPTARTVGDAAALLIDTAGGKIEFDDEL
jgi:hypothetical protein